MDGEKKVREILGQIVGNAKELKVAVSEGNLLRSAELTGERVALVEAFRELRDAKVSVATSDKKGEMEIMLKKAEKEIFEAIGSIHTRLSELRKALASTEGARKIAAYKIQGGPYGH